MRLNLDPRRGRNFSEPAEAAPPEPQDRVTRPSLSSDLDSLYREQKTRLLRFFSRRTSTEDAHDLVQETFVRYVGAESSAACEVRRPEAYLSRIAGNLLRDRAKASARSPAHLQIPAEEAALVGPDQQQGLEARDMLNRLQAAMLKLKPVTREIFMAHRLDGYSYAEIAARTGLSVKAVEKHMSRAIAHIDRSMGAR